MEPGRETRLGVWQGRVKDHCLEEGKGMTREIRKGAS